MSDKKPTPVLPESSNKICPVCGKRSYSPSGVHPQCAVRQADASERKERKAERKPEVKRPKRRSWDKKCPQCGVSNHVRRKTCACGYDFGPK